MTRAIAVGPKARAILEGFPTVDPTAFVFSPARATAERMAARDAARKTPRWPSHLKHNAARRKAAPKRKPGERYAVTAYAHAIAKACQKAGLPHWHPNQLRHTFATAVRKQHGLDAAQVLLRHSRADVTQVYAERDETLAAIIAAKIG